MEKQIVNMTNWELHKTERFGYNLSGIADKHPRLGRNTYVAYTSTLENSSVENGVLTYETKNTIYKCPIKYMSCNAFKNYSDEGIKNTQSILENDNMLDDLIKIEIELSSENIEMSDKAMTVLTLIKNSQNEILEQREKFKQELIDVIKDNNYTDCIYFEVFDIGNNGTISYSVAQDDGTQKVGTVSSYIHTGMFQDSILYSNQDIDFRYFPTCDDTMETYHISNGIKQMYIKNCNDFEIFVNGEKIEPGKIQCVTKGIENEGLFSPDSVDGKCALFNPENEER